MLWWPIVAATASAVIVIATVWLANNRPSPWRAVNVSSAWSASDSWTTNVTVLGSIVGIAAGVSGGFQHFPPAASQSSFVALTVLFGSAPAIAPVVYAAFAKAQVATPPTGTPGTILGTELAGVGTLLGGFGEIYLGMELARHASVSGATQAAFLIPLALAVVITGIYAYRGLDCLVASPPPGAAPAAGAVSPSLMSGISKASGTL